MVMTQLRMVSPIGNKQAQDRDSMYLLLRGLSAVWRTAAPLTFSSTHPFPRSIPTCG